MKQVRRVDLKEKSIFHAPARRVAHATSKRRGWKKNTRLTAPKKRLKRRAIKFSENKREKRKETVSEAANARVCRSFIRRAELRARSFPRNVGVE